MNLPSLSIDNTLFTQSKYHSGVPTPKASPRTPSNEDDRIISIFLFSSLGYLTNRLHVFSQMPTCIVMCGLPVYLL